MKKQSKLCDCLYKFVIIFSIIFFLSIAHQSVFAGKENPSPFLFNSNSEYWPTDTWKSTLPESVGMSSEKLSGMFDKIESDSSNIETILIIRKSFIILEASKHDLGRLHPVYSSTKSVTSALFGIAISKGYIKNINQSALEYFPEILKKNDDSRKQNISLKHLLTMSSGLKWPEIKSYYADPKNPVFQMKASDDWVDFVFKQPLSQEPGSIFNYNSGGAHVLLAVMNKSGIDVPAFTQKHLFAPLGISETEYIWAPGTGGIPNGSHGLYIKTRDFAKFGYLVLKGGFWEQEQIISKSWIEESTTRQIKMTWGGMVADHYGYQWYVQPFGFNSLGNGGQYLFVIPKLDLVIVFLGNLANNDLNIPVELVKDFIIPAVMSSREIPEDKDFMFKLDSKIKRFTGEIAN